MSNTPEKALKRIEKAKRNNFTKLNLNNCKLTEFPPEIFELTNLTELELDSNQLTIIPEAIGNLTNLTKLDLYENELTTLPDSLGQLTHLTELNLSKNKLTALPESIGQLKNLIDLYIWQNQLTYIPASIGQLTQLKTFLLPANQLKDIPDSFSNLRDLIKLDLGHIDALIREQVDQKGQAGFPLQKIPDYIRNFQKLESLGVEDCQLSFLPEWLNELTKLRVLSLRLNNLTDLPPSIAQLEHLKTIQLEHNPLNPALQSAYNKGLDAVKAYLRSLAENAEPLYEAKLVLVGEGSVGKTTLLKALKGDKGKGAPKKGEMTTHGVEIDIHGLKLPHPEKEGIEIQLNAWDFGGQDVYRVTHQFFFSGRSLYLLVWEPRRGVQQGQVEDWLNMIRLRVGEDARVLIVSTHCKTGERIARIDKPVFKQQYGEMIVGFYEVDSLVPDESTGEMVGIAELKKVIADESAKLEQMGMKFNRNWKAARDELLTRSEPRISYQKFYEICTNHSLSQIDSDTLAHLMHDLGYIVHYSDDEKLRDDVVLKPEWLTKAIGFVLEDRTTKEMDGILNDSRLFKV